jgi:hypothetical protein
MFFDYLELLNSLEEQSVEFLNKAKRHDTQWAQHSLMVFLDFHKERVRRKKLAPGTLKNYYGAAKLFCDIIFLDFFLEFLIFFPYRYYRSSIFFL